MLRQNPERIPTHYFFEKGCAFIMSKKIAFRGHSTQTYAEVFQSFISAKTAEGVADITIRNYHNNLHVISKYLDTSRPLGDITKSDLDEMIVAMRRAGLAHNHQPQRSMISQSSGHHHLRQKSMRNWNTV